MREKEYANKYGLKHLKTISDQISEVLCKRNAKDSSVDRRNTIDP